VSAANFSIDLFKYGWIHLRPAITKGGVSVLNPDTY
jgi:hypothetical protein